MEGPPVSTSAGVGTRVSGPPDDLSLEARLAGRASALGLALCGVTRPDRSGHMPFYEAWLTAGHHGSMGYLAREDSVARRADLRGTIEDVRSVVVVADEYYVEDAPAVAADPARAVVARYARGQDYHDVLKRKLEDLLRWLDREVPGGARGRAYVDTGPILERELAQRAGLGWFGRNTMLINPRRGSYFFLGVLLVDVALSPSTPFEEDRCGTCSACVDACPTGALLGRAADGAPVIDARRCISYLTIELRGPIPRELRAGIGNRVFGCDICQEVCPWNERFARPSAEEGYAPRSDLSMPRLDGLAANLLDMDEDAFRLRFRGSPLRRARRRGMLRNVVVALGNRLGGGDVPEDEERRILGLLERALGDEEPLVQGHAAWALGCHDSDEARSVLRARAEGARDPFVREEIGLALKAEAGSG